MTTHYSDKKDMFPLEGGCVCGLIRYALTLPPIIVHCCYCTACQRQTGTLFALNAVVESSALTLLPSASPTVAGNKDSPDPLPADIMPTFVQTASSISALENKPEAKPLPICIPTESGIGQIILQCPACRTTVWNHYADAGAHIAYLRVGTLDKAWEIQPDVHIFTRSRPWYLKMEDGKPQFEAYYPDRMELLRPEAKKRAEAMKKTVGDWQTGMYGKALSMD